jgi:cobyrinic acid a,c-diamide synthase
MNRILFSAASSSSGKTTMSMLMIAYARKQGFQVAPFKCGPDFIDSQYLEKVSGRDSYNLDEWMSGGSKGVLHSFSLGARGADFAVIEGVMGLYDGKRGEAFGKYSSAGISKVLKTPVVICLSARKTGQTLATQLLGLMKADAGVSIVGAIINDCANQKLYDFLASAIKGLCGVPCFGYLPRLKELEISERPLGLSPPSEQDAGAHRFEAALALASRSLDFPGLLKVAKRAKPLPVASLSTPKVSKNRVRVAYAKDAAFHFYYRENLGLLEAAGAELIPFSPLEDSKLPQGIQGLLLGGGFPERFGEGLEKNEFIRREIGAKVLEGLPVWAECGGLMYLCSSLTDIQGQRHLMAGAFAAEVLMTKKLQNFGYAQAQASKETILLPKGKVLRGHEFHHSEIFWREKPKTAWKISQPEKELRDEAFLLPAGLATYFHAHLASFPQAAAQFMQRCLKRGIKDA